MSSEISFYLLFSEKQCNLPVMKFKFTRKLISFSLPGIFLFHESSVLHDKSPARVQMHVEMSCGCFRSSPYVALTHWLINNSHTPESNCSIILTSMRFVRTALWNVKVKKKSMAFSGTTAGSQRKTSWTHGCWRRSTRGAQAAFVEGPTVIFNCFFADR